MPQILRRPKIQAIGLDALEARPVLAQRIAQIIAQWSLVVSLYDLMLAMIAGPDVEIALVMQEAIVGSSAADATLRAVAGVKLTPELQDQISESLTLTRSRAKDRNAIAHGIWAISPSYPRDLLLVHPRELARAQGRVILQNAITAPKRRKPRRRLEEAALWKGRDFDQALERINDHAESVAALAEAVGRATGHWLQDEQQAS